MVDEPLYKKLIITQIFFAVGFAKTYHPLSNFP